MSQNCNRIVRLSTDALAAKASFAQSVSVALSGALSDCYKGIEFAHGDISPPTEVYLRSADEKLASAMRALAEVDSILRSAPLDAEAVAWTQQLDFDRLYSNGVRQAMIPANAGQWSRLVELNATGKVLSISAVLLKDLSEIRARIQDMLESTKDNNSRRNRAGVPIAALRLQSALVDAAAFGQMVAYVNTLEPLDPQWLSQKAKVREEAELTV